MTRWLDHCRDLPARNHIGAAISLVVLIASVLALAWQIRELATDQDGADPPARQNPEAARARAWSKTKPLLDRADRDAALALDKHLASIHEFLDERHAGCRAFAARLLSLRGKWELVKSQLGSGSDYAAFLQQAFSEHVFPMDELEKAVATAIRSYLAELDRLDDELLVRLRTDLADGQLPQTILPALSSDQAFRRHYRELRQRVTQDVRADLALVAGRELFLWQATNVATDLTFKAGTALAGRLGLSSTILGAGAATSWRTLGVGIVLAIGLDAVADRIIKAVGYDAEEQLTARAARTLNDLGHTLTDGDPEACATLEKLKVMQLNDPDAEVRTACAEAIRSIEAGLQPYGLRRELTALTAARASVRREALRRLILVQEVSP
jgi:hypothetical protein